MLEAIMGPLMVWLVLDEPLGLHAFVGGAFVLGGVAFRLRPAREPAQEATVS